MVRISFCVPISDFPFSEKVKSHYQKGHFKESHVMFRDGFIIFHFVLGISHVHSILPTFPLQWACHLPISLYVDHVI